MSDPIDWHIIDRHIAGESSATDEEQLRRWLQQDPRNAELLDELRAAGHPADERSPWNVDAAWTTVSRRIDDVGTTLPLTLHPGRERAQARRGRAWRIAGATTTVLAAAAIIGIVVRPASVASISSVSSPMREISSARAQQTRVTLHDGTRVVLNAGSRLRYSADFGRTSRDVELDGEGYFEVMHDESRPFRVHARGGVAEDLGTRFVVRAYPESRQLLVMVAEGRVALRRDSANAERKELGAGQLGRIEANGAISVINGADADRWMSWTHGGLVLDGLSLADAATEIGRRFDVRVDVATPELAARHVSARFRDEPLPAVLDALTLAIGARWTRDGQTIVISRSE